jgi:hypothetical protein
MAVVEVVGIVGCLPWLRKKEFCFELARLQKFSKIINANGCEIPVWLRPVDDPPFVIDDPLSCSLFYFIYEVVLILEYRGIDGELCFLSRVFDLSFHPSFTADGRSQLPAKNGV